MVLGQDGEAASMNGWHYRNHHDAVIIRDVFEKNEYGVPADMTRLRVLDVGGHIGSFARLCAERGAVVTSYEPDPQSAALYRQNTVHVADRVTLHEAAVSDVGGEAKLMRIDDAAGNNICWGREGDVVVKVVGIDDAIRRAGVVVDLLKLDCEGAEYAILEGPSPLSGVRAILIEFHDNYVGNAQFRAEVCRRRLESLGFREECWEAIHVTSGNWYRLFRGVRD